METFTLILTALNTLILIMGFSVLSSNIETVKDILYTIRNTLWSKTDKKVEQPMPTNSPSLPYYDVDEAESEINYDDPDWWKKGNIRKEDT